MHHRTTTHRLLATAILTLAITIVASACGQPSEYETQPTPTEWAVWAPLRTRAAANIAATAEASRPSAANTPDSVQQATTVTAKPTPDIETTVAAQVATAVARRLPATPAAPTVTKGPRPTENYPTPTTEWYRTGIQAANEAEKALATQWFLHIQNQECTEAAKLLPQLLTIEDRSPHAAGTFHSGTAECHLNTGRYPAALRNSNEAIRRNPDESSYHYTKAKTEYQMGNCRPAEEAANATLERNSRLTNPSRYHAFAYVILYICAAERGDYATALLLAERALATATEHGMDAPAMRSITEGNIAWFRQQTINTP